jgi:benzoate/toluate 1,2-dioxygenase subunit beta
VRDDVLDRQRIVEFIYKEARLQDEGLYDAWEALWTDDALYWVPAGGDDIDPDKQISYVYDNRNRIRTRIKQLKTEDRYSQVPPSRMRRVISNLELEEGEEGEVIAGSNFILVETRAHGLTTWAGRTIHKIREENGGLKLSYKKVMLVNNAEEIPTMSFLI